MSIYIQIASYRDPELSNTIEDCINNADSPDDLVFGICLQRDIKGKEQENFYNKYKEDERFRIIDVDYKKAKGVCWARHAVQQNYKGEDYTLQLDSHHRFVKGWDSRCIKMLKQLQDDGFEKPLLTSYIPSFDPDNDPTGRVQTPWKMTFDRFIPEGAIFFLPADVENFNNLERPIRGRFYSAHFAFTLGKFSEEVQHDPEYYFHGEEISIAVRAFTHGYDIFHPHMLVAWHEYTRKGRVKHWDESKDWTERNSKSHLKNRKLFAMDGEDTDEEHRFGKYGFGKARTLEEYEKYAGISFSKRAVQKYTLDHKEPPNPEVEDWDKSLCKIFKHCIDIGYDQVPEDDYDFWCVAFKDSEGNDMYRQDADKDEILRMKADPDGYCKVWRQFETDNKPHSWIVWPHSESKGWSQEIVGTL